MEYLAQFARARAAQMGMEHYLLEPVLIIASANRPYDRSGSDEILFVDFASIMTWNSVAGESKVLIEAANQSMRTLGDETTVCGFFSCEFQSPKISALDSHICTITGLRLTPVTIPNQPTEPQPEQ